MLSFQRFLSMMNIERLVFDYKDIYSFQGLYCVLRTNYQAHRDWVNQFFKYFYHHCSDHLDILAPHQENQCEFYSLVDEPCYLRLMEWIEESILLRVGYFEDDIAEITFKDGGMVVDRQKKIIICYDQSYQQIYFVSDGSDPSIKYELAHSMREMFSHYLEERGFYLLRASAVEKDGKSILFCGDEGAGKTTILLGLMEQGYHLLSDQWVYIGIENRKIKTISCPGAVGVTLATTMHFDPLIDVYADLGSLTLPQKQIHSLVLDDLEENDVDKIDLSVEEIVSAFHSKFTLEAELGELMIIDDYLPYENFTDVQDPVQAIRILKSHTAFPSKTRVADAWRDELFPDWYQKKHPSPKRVKEQYELTLRIIANLRPLKKLGKSRTSSVETKLKRIVQNL